MSVCLSVCLSVCVSVCHGLAAVLGITFSWFVFFIFIDSRPRRSDLELANRIRALSFFIEIMT